MERRFFMNKKNISITLDKRLLEKINTFAKSRYMTRSSAISYMINKVKIIVIQDGAEIVKLLFSIDSLLKNSNLSYEQTQDIERICNRIWQLLNLITEEIQQAETQPID